MKKIILAVAIAALASMSVVAFASADVARTTQLPTTLDVSLTDAQLGNHHTFNIVWNCDGTFTGTGQGSASAGGANETISGTLVGDQLTFTAVYTDFIPGYTWTFDGLLNTNVALGGQATTYHATAAVKSTTFKNHGAYVSSMGGGDDAAHSCIGMPVK